MAATYRLHAVGIPFTAANESLVAIYNTSASLIVKIYRITILNNQVTALTGGQNLLTVTRYTEGTITAGNWIHTPVPLHSSNPAWSASIICASKMTIASPTTTDDFLRIAWTNDEPTIATGTIDEYEVPLPFATVIDYAFADSNIEPIYLRQNQTLSIQNVGFTATAPANAGIVDIIIEMTVT